MTQKIHIQQMKKLVKWNHHAQKALCVLGPAGVGKSEGVFQASKELQSEEYSDREFVVWDKINEDNKKQVMTTPEKYFVLIDTRLSNSDQTDVKGIPYRNEKYVEWFVERYLWFFTNEASAGILLFDEFNQAPQSVLNGFFKIFHDRVVNDKPLSAKVSIVALGNRGQKDKAFTFEIPAPMKDRMSEYEFKFDRDLWTEYVIDNDLVRTDILTFLDYKRAYLTTEATTKDGNKTELKMITPRGIVLASEIWTTAEEKEKKLSEDDIELIVSGRLNEAFATEFMAYRKVSRKVDVKALMNNPKSIEKIQELDLLYGAITALVDEYRKDKAKNINPMVDISLHIKSEFGTLMLKLMKGSDNTFKNRLVKSKNWKELVSKYSKMLVDDE